MTVLDDTTITLRPVPEQLTVRLTGERIVLPADLRTKVDEFWQAQATGKHPQFNGEVFTVVDVRDSGNKMEILLSETDYAHYLYGIRVGGLGEHTVRILHPAALVITSDDSLIVGAMGTHTATPGIVQTCAGGLDHDDVRSDGTIDVEHNVTKELQEELNIDATNDAVVSELYPAYLKEGGPTGKMTIVYVVRLLQSCQSFMDRYASYAERMLRGGGEPEFAKVCSVSNDPESVEAFLREHAEQLNEYLAVTFRAAAREL